VTKINKYLFEIKKNFPVSLKRLLFKTLHFGSTYYCNVCNSNLKRFLPGGLNQRILSELEIIGGGYHEFDYCPVCKASYRQRLIKLYLDEFQILKPNLRILHIAPEESLYYLLRRKNKSGYVCGDLFPELYNYYSKPIFTDLTALSFPDNSFDMVVCNHVLEHVPDDRKAMSEIYRVLDKGGLAILQVPISEKLNETYEDSLIQSEEERLNKFGQRDHVRIYALDYIERLKFAGFRVEIIPSTSFSNVKNFSKLMLDKREKLFTAHK
jgi:SAM-dependent methyltransferase